MSDEASERGKLRQHISELTDQMMLAFKDPEAIPTLKDVRDTLASVCDVYRLLHGTGDLDTGGDALRDYQSKVNGNGAGKYQNRGRNGSGRAGTGKRASRVGGTA